MDADGRTGMPRWVKVLVALVAVLILVLIISKLAGVDHGPGMHSGAPATTVQSESAAPSGGGHTPPPGAHAP